MNESLASITTSFWALVYPDRRQSLGSAPEMFHKKLVNNCWARMAGRKPRDMTPSSLGFLSPGFRLGSMLLGLPLKPMTKSADSSVLSVDFE